MQTYVASSDDTCNGSAVVLYLCLVDPDKFVRSDFGGPHREPGNKWAFWYYRPSPIPRRLNLDMDTVLALSRADAAVGNLNGLGALLRDPELLIGPYVTREAVASSRIEGTQTTFADVLRAEASPDLSRNEGVLEVHRYVEASNQAFELSKELPISQRLILAIHRTLLQGVRGERLSPGKFRTSPVWVGPKGVTLEAAEYVPPLPDEIPGLMNDWEQFVNETTSVPVLIQAGLMHYQFETIHPFLDGNGRIGRLLINLLLKERGVLSQPLLYISGYLEANRSEYYQRLQAVREGGEIQQWLQFFLNAVEAQARDGIWRAGALVQVRERMLIEAQQSKARLHYVVDSLVRNPFITVSVIQRAAGFTSQGARNLIRQAEERGWIRSIGSSGRGGREHWYSPEIFSILEAPNRYGGSFGGSESGEDAALDGG